MAWVKGERGKADNAFLNGRPTASLRLFATDTCYGAAMLKSPGSRTFAAFFVLAVPFASIITRIVVDRHSGFGGPETVAWYPLLRAQLLLTAIFLVFGPQSLSKRILVFAICGVLFTAQYVFALEQVIAYPQWMLQRIFEHRLREAQSFAKHSVLRPVVCCLILMPIRGFVGEMRFGSAPVHQPKYSIHDMLVVTTLVAVVIAWCKFSYLSFEMINSGLTRSAMEILAAICLASSVLARGGKVCSFALFSTFAVIRETMSHAWGVPWMILIPGIKWCVLLALVFCFRHGGLSLGKAANA